MQGVQGIVIVAVAALAAGGCNAGSDPRASEPAIGPVPVIERADQLVLPLDAYFPREKAYVASRRASWLLTRDCVQRFGAQYTLTEQVLMSDLPPFKLQNNRRYGIIDPASAVLRGYNIPPDMVPGAAGKAAASEQGWRPSDAEMVLVRGAEPGTPVPNDAKGAALPEGGCSGEADRLLLQGESPSASPVKAPADLDLASRLQNDTHKRAEKDSRVQAAMTAWSECMQRSGHSYKTIWDPNNAKWPDPAGASEIAVAKADVACKRESNLTGIWFAVETAYQKEAMAKNAAALDEVRTYYDALARNAARIVGG